MSANPNLVVYGNWEIAYNPPPIPSRNCDWQFSHKDFDGAEDACDNRYGAAPSLIEAMNDIDDMEEDAFDCLDCRMADPSSCMRASFCKWREDQKARHRARALLTKAGKDGQ